MQSFPVRKIRFDGVHPRVVLWELVKQLLLAEPLNCGLLQSSILQHHCWRVPGRWTEVRRLSQRWCFYLPCKSRDIIVSSLFTWSTLSGRVIHMLVPLLPLIGWLKIPQYVHLVISLLTVEHMLINCVDFDVNRQNFSTASNLKYLFSFFCTIKLFLALFACLKCHKILTIHPSIRPSIAGQGKSSSYWTAVSAFIPAHAGILYCIIYITAPNQSVSALSHPTHLPWQLVYPRALF